MIMDMTTTMWSSLESYLNGLRSRDNFRKLVSVNSDGNLMVARSWYQENDFGRDDSGYVWVFGFDKGFV